MKYKSNNIQERLYPLSKMFNTFFIIHTSDNTLARGKGCESNGHENYTVIVITSIINLVI